MRRLEIAPANNIALLLGQNIQNLLKLAHLNQYKLALHCHIGFNQAIIVFLV